MFLLCPECLKASAEVRKKTGFVCGFCKHAWDPPLVAFGNAYYRGLGDLEGSFLAPGGERFFLRGFPAVLGRNSDFQALRQNLAISRRHFRIDSLGGALTVTDLGSRSGTCLNGKQIPANQPQQIDPGDSLRVSGVELRLDVRLNESPPANTGSQPGPEVISLDTGAATITVGGRDSSADIHLPFDHGAGVSACFFRGGREGSWRALAIQPGGIVINGRAILEHEINAGDELSIGPFRYLFESAKSLLRPCQPAQALGISARKLVFSVNTREGSKRILNDVSVDIPAGKLTMIVGASGCGKTTLAKVLSGISRAESGEIRVNGQAIALDSLRQEMTGKIGFVSQDDIIHRELTVRETMDYAASLRLGGLKTSNEKREVIDRILNDLELLAHQTKLASQLSGGQRKRLNVAVELINSPSLLILDEPTTGLDAGSERELIGCLRRLAYRGRTIALITHSLSILESADHVVFMTDDGSGGRVLAQGGPHEVKQAYNFENWGDLFARNRSRRSRGFARQIRTHRGFSRFSLGLPRTATLFLRYLNVWATNPLASTFSLVLLPFLLGLLTRLALPLDGRTGTERMLFGVICALWLGMNQTVREIVKEKNIMLRENFAGIGCGQYLLSKLAFFVCIGAVQSISLLAPMVWLRVQGVSLSLSFVADIACPVKTLWLMFWLALVVGASLGLLTSAIALFLRTKGEIVAVLLVVLLMLPQILFSEKVLGNLTQTSADYHAFVITDETQALPQIASYFTVSRYLYLPLAAVNRSKEGISSIFAFNATIIIAFVLICIVLTWLTMEVFLYHQRRSPHW